MSNPQTSKGKLEDGAGASAGRGSREEGPSKVKKRTPFFSFLKPLFAEFLSYARHCSLHGVYSLVGECISTFFVASDRNQFKLDSTKGNLLAHLIEKSGLPWWRSG